MVDFSHDMRLSEGIRTRLVTCHKWWMREVGTGQVISRCLTHLAILPPGDMQVICYLTITWSPNASLISCEKSTVHIMQMSHSPCHPSTRWCPQQACSPPPHSARRGFYPQKWNQASPARINWKSEHLKACSCPFITLFWIRCHSAAGQPSYKDSTLFYWHKLLQIVSH